MASQTSPGLGTDAGVQARSGGMIQELYNHSLHGVFWGENEDEFKRKEK
jgi:hypothetical protein